MNEAAIFIIGMISAFFRSVGGRACRFHPSCSVYGTAAFRRFGFFRACALTLSRVLRCHPFSPGGHDPLPVAVKERD